MYVGEGIGVHFGIFLSGENVPGVVVGEGRECNGVPGGEIRVIF